MTEALIRALASQRGPMRRRWEALLRTERTATPLANPDVLVRMFDMTLDEIFRALASTERVTMVPKPTHICRRNPYLVYYEAAEQALLEALIMAQVELAPLAAGERDESLADLRQAVRSIAYRDISAFNEICQEQEDALPVDSPLFR
jgi:hypothetical protein